MLGLFWLGVYIQVTQGYGRRVDGNYGDGNSHFHPPAPDHLAQMQTGFRPTTEHSAIETLRYKL